MYSLNRCCFLASCRSRQSGDLRRHCICHTRGAPYQALHLTRPARRFLLLHCSRTRAGLVSLVVMRYEDAGVMLIESVGRKFELASGKLCHLTPIRNDLIPNYYLLAFPIDQGQPSSAEVTERLNFG